jgi:signal transduction histidine kinase
LVTTSALARYLLRTDPRVVDAVLAVGMLALAVEVGREWHPAGFRRFDAGAYALCALTILPLAARRRAPMAVLVAACAGFTVYLAAGYQSSVAIWGPILGLYTVAAMRPSRVTWIGAALTAAVIGYSGAADRLWKLGVILVQAVLIPGVTWLFGAGSHQLAVRNAQLADLTEQLRLEQAARARQAVTEERVRIARELHDVVAHHMSVISVQAGLAGYVFATDLPTVRNALGTIAATSREALEEMRRMLALLRVGPEDFDAGADDDRPYTPAPDLHRLGELAERVGAAGVPVRLRVEGAARQLPAGAGLCAYRVVQEALTNVLKHASPCQATVTVQYRGDELEIRIVDDGRQPVPAIRTGSAGHGLIGMRERARIIGGTVTAGPRPQGGFEVRLVLPILTASGPPRGGRSE